MEFELGGARDNGISGENVADNRNRVEEVSTMVGGGGGSSGGHLRYADSRLHGPMRVIGPPLGRRRYRGRAKLAPDPIQSLSDQPDPFSIRQLFSMEEEEEEN